MSAVHDAVQEWAVMKVAEYIEREAVYNTLKAMYCDECTDEKCQMCEYANIMFVLDNLPIADVQPVKRGRWIEHHDLIECNVCGFEVKDTYCEKRDMTSSETSYDYCPKCGADMRSPEATKG